ncbi:MAG: helix-turn-helix domain-containing protein [bacterium]
MKATELWESEQVEETGAEPETEQETPASDNNIATLKELTLRLLHEVQCMGEVHTVRFDSGLDFYDEVSRFEIDLIKRALLQTAGHQVRAARLLNLKVTTLNSKIKHYNINLNGFAHGFPMTDPSSNGSRQHA